MVNKNMEEELMVVGITAVNEETMKLELVPLVKSKKKENILDIALSGNTQQIMKKLEQEKQHRHIIYRSREWCTHKKIMPFTGMTMSLDTSINHKNKTNTE